MSIDLLPILIPIVIIILYFVISARMVGPTETGIVVRLGEPRRVIQSGIHFLLPRGIENVVRYPTKQYNFTFPQREMITKRGEHEGERYEAAVLRIDAVLYLRWPQDLHLIEAFRTAPPPGLANVLMDFFEESVVGTLREVIGDMTWREAIENRRAVSQRVTHALITEAMSPFRLAGISDLNFVIKEILLPEALQQTITLPQVEELRRRGIEQEARAERSFIEAQGQAYRRLGAWGPLAAIFALFGKRKTPPPREI